MYLGRFAPSPTGPLHFGSLIAAVGSYLDARQHQGQWLLRIDDLDPPREVPGAASDILRTLEAFGFEWDGNVSYQSQRQQYYAEALATLTAQQLTYPCICSRKQIAAQGRSGPYGPVYPGTCRQRPATSHATDEPVNAAIRLRTDSKTIGFIDRIQGQYAQNIALDIGDFTLLRRDNIYSYHLAVAVDDAEQQVSHIVRGYDLLDSTPRQILLQQHLCLPTPAYAHLPLAVSQSGQKLSKQNLATPLDTQHAPQLLWQALSFLGQSPDTILKQANLSTLWQWALQHWSLSKVPRDPELAVAQ